MASGIGRYNLYLNRYKSYSFKIPAKFLNNKYALFIITLRIFWEFIPEAFFLQNYRRGEVFLFTKKGDEHG